MAGKKKLCTKSDIDAALSRMMQYAKACKSELARQERDDLISMIQTYYNQLGWVEDRARHDDQ